MTITAHTPRYTYSGTIELVLNHPQFGEIPFCASPADLEPHGRDLYARAITGEFGPIAAYVAPPTPTPTPRACSSLQFMDRFTESEQLSIVTATMCVPQVKIWYDRMIAATEIVYKDPRTIGGLQALVTAGLITQERIDEILPVAWR